jgi:16S rRNA (guanine1516-N2)-methyltransferase
MTPPRRSPCTSSTSADRSLVVVAASAADVDLAAATAFAERHAIPFAGAKTPSPAPGLLVRVGADGAGLVEGERSDDPATAPVSPDFGRAAVRNASTRARGSDPLIHALGVRRGVHEVLDASAGLGRDALALAAAGATVTLVERHPLLDGLLRLALERGRAEAAANDDPDHAAVLARLRIAADRAVDSGTWMASDERRRTAPSGFDAVYLDPMYRHGRRLRTPGRETAVLRRLLDDGQDGQADLADWLATARACASRRVVVKRQPSAPPLDPAIKPIATVRGLSVRYDVYAPRAEGGS